MLAPEERPEEPPEELRLGDIEEADPVVFFTDVLEHPIENGSDEHHIPLIQSNGGTWLRHQLPFFFG